MTLPKREKENIVSFKKFYGNRIPEKVDLSESCPNRRYDLRKYVLPFAGNRNKLIEIYGTSFSDPKSGFLFLILPLFQN